MQTRVEGMAVLKAVVTSLAAALVFLGVSTRAATPAGSPNPVENFYRNRTVTILVGFTAGGGYDLYARTLARHIGRHIPGNPTVIVQNMPGAGSLVATNYLYNVAPRDGSMFAIFPNTLLIQALIGAPEVRFDPTRFGWIGSMNADVYMCVARRDAPVKTFRDLLTTPLCIGGTGPGATTDTQPRLFNGLLGTKFELIVGYPGGNEVDLALERGEIQGRCGLSWSTAIARKPEWFDKNNPLVTILFQTGRRRHPQLAEVPLIRELTSDERARRILDTFFIPAAMARAFAAPPNVPAERLAALRRAFMATVEDPELRKEATRIRLELNDPLTGEEVQQLVDAFFHAPEDQVAVIKQYVE